MSPDSSQYWRRRLVLLRGVVASALGLLFLLLEMHAATPLPAFHMVLWLALLLTPSLLFLLTRKRPPQGQYRLLQTELGLDLVLTLVVLHQMGAIAHPMAFYLLVPVLMAALSLSSAAAVLATTTAAAGFGFALHMHTTAALPGAPSALPPGQGFGLWLVFSILAATMTLLGQLLRNAQHREHERRAAMLDLAMRRERMYQVATSLADRAHELNTPLSSMMLLCENLLEEADLPPSLHGDLEQLHALSRRLAGQIRPRQEDARPEAAVDLAEVIRDTARELRHLAPGMEFHWEGPENPRLRRTELWRRVLRNLAYNACDAGAQRLQVACHADGEDRVLQISDDGPRHERAPHRESLGIGLALVETSLAAAGTSLELEYSTRWTQARIRIPAGECT